jgi:uncharacterized membrane protein
MLMIYISPASAQYSYELVIPPDAENAALFGINKAGKVVGRTFDSEFEYSFEYDMKKGLYMPISEEFKVRGINNAGVMVGDVEGDCAIRDKDGTITTFSPTSYDYYCEARGVNGDGKVSGFEIDDGVWSGFIYDSEYDTSETFLSSRQTFAQGIDAKGQIVGSVYLPAGDVFPP